MRIAFLGFGLIGGSLAKALRSESTGDPRESPLSIVAWTPSGSGPRQAVADGVLDAALASAAAAVSGADIVILAGPPLACLELIGDLGGLLREALDADATITDVASTKAMIVSAADRAGLRFVGGHPMAGRELAGYAAATADLFAGRPWVVVPGSLAGPDDVDRVDWLARRAGAVPIRLAAEMHDDAVAAISHAPLVLAAALVEAVAGEQSVRAASNWPVARRLAASGWQSMTRLARGDVDMGAGILATNAASVAGRLRDVRAVLDAWIDELENNDAADPDAAAARLRAARRLLESSSGQG